MGEQGCIELADGVACHMGDGVFAVMQIDDQGTRHCVVQTEADMETMLASLRAS
jgi:hypothetical protein